MSRQTYTLVKDDEQLYIKELLQRKMLLSSRLMRKLKLVNGAFRLDGKPCRLRDKGKAGQILSLEFPDEVSYFEPENIALDIRYEDDDLLVVNKQPFLVVHPTKNYQTGTLANALSYYIQESGQHFKLRFVNRLDRDTSGLLIVAKNPHAQDFLNHEMQQNRVIKKYTAVCHGIVTTDGIVDEPIAKDPNHVARRMVTPEGQPSVTHYHVISTSDVLIKNNSPLQKDTYISSEKECPDGFSLLELKLDTGRTHQIRVHMSYTGHILVGDDLYGSPAFPYYFGRQALHAAHLEFKQPVTGKVISVDAPLPQDMQELCRKTGLLLK